jgi:uncharacterized membrane protein required for colicin V production
MVWDVLIVLLLITLAVAGWSVGIVNSWRGPFALIVATVVTQRYYVDFATWIVQQLRTSPEQSIAIAYILLWGAVEIIAELLLSVLLPFNKKTRPLVPERLMGSGLGVFKGFVVILAPLIALQGPIKVPQAPEDKSNLINPVVSRIEGARLVGLLTEVAKGLKPTFGGIVINTKDPSFQPNYAGTNALDEEQKK